MKAFLIYTGRALLLLILFAGKIYAQGLTLLKDINSGTAHGFNVNVTFLSFNNKPLFLANNGTSGYELWTSDGTAAGTTMVKDLNPGIASLSNTTYTAVYNNALFMTGGGNLTGTGTYNHWIKTDGTSGGTVPVVNLHDKNPGGTGELVQQALVSGSYLFFNLQRRRPDVTTGFAYELWQTDGTDAGTKLTKDIAPGQSPAVQALFAANGILFFSANDGVNGAELWRTDGTEAGTFMVKDINPGSASNYFNGDAGLLGNSIFFSADDGSQVELWKSDGTSSGTVLLKDINPTGSGNPASFITVNNTVFFTANDGVSGVELWKTDGTTAGTVLVKDINSGSGSSGISSMMNVNGTLFFAADDGVHGKELWKSDGTAAGTVMVKDANAGGSSTVLNPVVVNNLLFYQNNDGVNGTELWRSDGTEAGTFMARDITAGSGSSSFTSGSYVVYNGWLFFLRANGTVKELWKSDGTASGTVPVHTLNTVNSYTIVNGIIYASVTTTTYGRELFSGDPNAKLDQVITFNPLPGKTYGDAIFALTAGSGSGLPVSFSSSDESIAKIVNDNEVQILRAGTVTITSHQAGNNAYNAAPDAGQQLVIDKAPLTITAVNKTRLQFTPNPPLEVTYSGFVNGDDEQDLDPSATISTVADDGSDVGDYDIVPSGAGSGNYTITFVNGTLTVVGVPLIPQTINFASLSAKTVTDADFDPGALAGSGLPVVYTSSNSAVATIVNNQVHITGAGTTVIKAFQPGNRQYEAAMPVEQTLVVNKLTQVVTFAPLPLKTYGDAVFDAGASASSGLPVDYTSSNTAVAVIENRRIRIVGMGNATITAIQGGDAMYEAAPAVTQELRVAKPQLIITAENKTRFQGQDNPVLTFTVSGFVNDDNIYNLTTPVVLVTTATAASAPGEYDILISGATASAYDIVFVNGKLIVNPVPVDGSKLEGWFSGPGSLQVNIYVSDGQKAALQLLDVSGRLLTGAEVSLSKGQNSYMLPVANLSAGAYILKVKGTNLQLDKKILKR